MKSLVIVMKKRPRIHLQQLHQELGDIVCHLTKVQFCQFGQDSHWRPAVNAYRCGHRFIICVDLAGVEKKTIDVRVEQRRLIIRGQRPAPEPPCDVPEGVQVFAMEIDNGPFERDLALPVDVEPEQVTAEHRNGLLWIDLPLRADG